MSNRIIQLEEKIVKMQKEHLDKDRILTNLGIINSIVIESSDLKKMLTQVLQQFLTIFSCDRAWIFCPYDPGAPPYDIFMEETVPEWPGAKIQKVKIPKNEFNAKVFAEAIATKKAVWFDPEHNPIDPDSSVNKQFNIKSELLLAIFPKSEIPWLLGIHHCSIPSVYSQNDRDLFEMLGKTLAAGISRLLSWKNTSRLVDQMGVSIWNEDLFLVLQALENFRSEGIDDLRKYLKSNPSILWDLVSKVKVLEVNQATLSLFGVKEEDEFLLQIDKTFASSSIEVFIDELCAIWEKKSSFKSETMFKTLDGREINTIISFKIPELAEAFRSIPVSITDITREKKLEAQLRQSQKMESIGNLAGGMAHDFNNILASILGFSELALADTERGSVMNTYLQKIHSGGRRAKEVVQQILAFARQAEVETKPIQLQNIINEVLKFIRSSIPTSIEINQKINSSSLMIGNATQIHQILMNLCTNAAYAMQKNGGVLELSLNDITVKRDATIREIGLKEGNYIEMKISDTGSGIRSKIIDLIFEPYFTTKGPGEGTGMGLAMVRGIVESYDGKIIVESKPFVKTIFTIYFPTTNTMKSENPSETEKIILGKERILFVDDEKDLVEMVTIMLESLGYVVTANSSSIEALELFKKNPNDFDLLITDLTMPQMTGDRLIMEIRKINSKIRTIICTGYSNAINDKNTEAKGIDEFMYKPFTIADFAATIRKVLDKNKDIN